jgi:hypothetical protein
MEISQKIWWGRVLWLWILLLFGTTSASGFSSEHPAPNFAVGQEWSIRSFPQSTAKVVIGRIEPWRDKIVVHVAIVDIPLSPAAAAATKLTEIAHVPFEQSALAGSVGNLVGTAVAPPPDFETGYRQWKEQQGGIFTVSVSQVIAVAQKTFNRHN